MPTISTKFVNRLKMKDNHAWYDLWDTFGSHIERMVETFGHRYFTQETVRDISQETMSRVYNEIDKFDVSRGVKFSTWVFSIAKHIVYSELRHRNTLKRGEGVRPVSLDESVQLAGAMETPPEEFEQSIFRAKVYKAIKLVEKQCEFIEFEVYRLKISDQIKSTEIARMVGVSEPTVSRYLKKVRERLKDTLRVVVAEYSWTDDEESDIDRNRLNTDEELFDGALSEIYISEEQARKTYESLAHTAKTMF